MKSIAIVTLLLFCALWVPGVQAEIYSWTDENGVKHFSHTPPPERSTPVKSAPEIQSDPTDYEIQEIINENNVDAIIKQMDEADTASPPKAAALNKPPSRQERIAAEAEKLQEKIAWLEQLPPEAYTNARSKQAIIGRYQYRLDQLQSNPDAYFKEYGY
ncbi:MAG: DUF4124 domain-containing protein [Desulfobacterales bacterium]|nr:DUF4124 domain-containing protein [Desulfobacterales bacterium]